MEVSLRNLRSDGGGDAVVTDPAEGFNSRRDRKADDILTAEFELSCNLFDFREHPLGKADRDRSGGGACLLGHEGFLNVEGNSTRFFLRK